MNSPNPFDAPQTQGEVKAITRRPTLWRAIVLVIVVIFVALVFLTPMRRAPLAGVRTRCVNNIRNIAFALRTYEAKHGTLPPAYTQDENGNRLHSWRTLILPYLDQQQLYDSIDLTKPWDAPENASASQTSLSVYSCPASGSDQYETTYLGVAIPGGVFADATPLRIDESVDPQGSTILLIEVADEDAVHWMEPADAGKAEIFDRMSKSETHQGVYVVAMLNGSVRTLPINLDEKLLNDLGTVQGGKEINEDSF